jgi:hypothetical protein
MRDGAPLSRLSRFDGETFHPVAEGSITTPFVQVFVHGWQPGFRLQERLHAVTDVVQALPAWDPRLIDTTGRTLISYYLPLLEALAGLGEDHTVLWYSWLDEAATDADLLLAFRSRQATQINGRRLALALQQACGRPTVGGPEPRLQLIGHSHGSAVAVHAAVSLVRPPAQVTLLDAPESSISRFSGAANLIELVLPRLRPGRGSTRPFVDSYSSVFGRPYHRKLGLTDVVDVALTPGRPPERHPIRAINWAHLYAVDWYARSVREAGRGVGYGWSPLRGGDLESLSSFYYSPQPYRPLDLHRRRDLPRLGAAKRLALRPTRRSPVEGASLQLSPAVPAAALILHSLPGEGLIEFDLAMVDGDGTEQIQIDVDAVPAFLMQGRFPVPRAGRYVLLSDGRPGDHLLTARLSVDPSSVDPSSVHPSSASPPRVSLTNITVVSWPGAAAGFSIQRAALATFWAGAATGSLATLLTLITTGWTVRKVLARLTRRRG